VSRSGPIPAGTLYSGNVRLRRVRKETSSDLRRDTRRRPAPRTMPSIIYCGGARAKSPAQPFPMHPSADAQRLGSVSAGPGHSQSGSRGHRKGPRAPPVNCDRPPLLRPTCSYCGAMRPGGRRRRSCAVRRAVFSIVGCCSSERWIGRRLTDRRHAASGARASRCRARMARRIAAMPVHPRACAAGVESRTRQLAGGGRKLLRPLRQRDRKWRRFSLLFLPLYGY
jgi:hypothetical protein